jgi:CO/xanthine dehydrogenase Mo-binding subunit
MDEALSLSRRSFLIAMAGSTAVFGFRRGANAAMDPATPTGAPPTPVNPLFEPTIWFSIDGEGFVTVNIIRAEMGQHVGTALARILADELEADWDKVRIVHVDTDPKWGLMITGASWSVWQTWPVFSRAGAAGRNALIDEGAKLLSVSPTVCTARGGAVVAGEQKISYGEILRRGSLDRRYTSDELAKLPIKPASERRPGRPRRGCAGHTHEDQRRRTLRHRRQDAEHGLRQAEDSTNVQRVEGQFGRR